MNLNTYDKGYKPYYPSMDPSTEGGELKKSKKKQKVEERKGITDNIEKPQRDTRNKNSLSRLMDAYEDDN